jgi:hypothetical protein
MYCTLELIVASQPLFNPTYAIMKIYCGYARSEVIVRAGDG